MKPKHSVRLFSMAMALLLIFGLAISPAYAQGDGWEVLSAEDSDYIYFYNGETQAPGTPYSSITVNKDVVDIYKYQLQNKEDFKEFFWTYCSDFATPPREYTAGGDESLLYKRTDIESVTAEQGFFSSAEYDFETTTAKLRAILLKTDLAFESIDALREATGITNLTESEAIAGAQTAIWYLVNAEVTLTAVNAFAQTGTPIRAYFNYLMALEGVGPDEMASINIKEFSKELDETGAGNSYKATIGYYVEGENVDPANVPELKDIKVTATYTLYDSGSGEYVDYQVPDSSIKTFGDAENSDYYTAVITGILRGATLNVTFEGVQKDVNTVYLYTTKNRSDSQTLVSVVKGSVPLKTLVTIYAPGEAIGLTVIKDWMNDYGSAKSLIPNTVAQGYESTFEITYYGNGNVFDGTKVIANFTISGNDSYKTQSVFEEGKYYKIKEISAVTGDEAEDAFVPQVKYFTVEDGKIVWTDADKNHLSASEQTNRQRFENFKTFAPGDVKIQKTVVSGENAPEADAFTFEVLYTAPSGEEAAFYAKEPYELYDADDNSITGTHVTDADGRITLKAGQYAIFKNLPPGSKLTVTELDTSGTLRNMYVMDTVSERTATLPDNGEMQTLTFTNTYKVGSLTIDKSFATNSALGWTDFPETGIQFIVEGADGYYKEVRLTEDEPAVTLTNMPIGTYTVTETGVGKTGYELTVNNVTVTGDSYEVEGTINRGGTSMAEFVNSYRKQAGELTITKVLLENSKSATNSALLNKIFEFTVEGPENYSKTIYLPVNNSWTETLYDLVPGEYTVTEITQGQDDVDGLNLTVLVDGVPGDSAAKQLADKGSIEFTFTNDYTTYSGGLTVVKNVTGAFNRDTVGATGAIFSFTIEGPGFPSGGETFTLPEDGNWSKTFTGLLPGVYTVTESVAGAGINYYDLTVTGGGTVTTEVKNKETASVEITNAYARQKGGVSFKKLVEDAEKYYNTSDKFTFEVKVSNVLYNGAYSVTDSLGTTTPGSTQNGTIVIGHGDTVSITGLDAGDTITITETGSGTYELKEITRDGTAVGSATATITQSGNPVFTFTNAKKLGKLNLTKDVAGLSSEQKAAMSYIFTITGPKGFGDVNNQATVTLDSSNEFAASFSNIPYGVYTIAETNKNSTAKIDGYTLVVTGEGNYTLNAAELNVAVRNTYTRDTGSLTVRKTVSDAAEISTAEAGKEFTFTVTFDPTLPSYTLPSGAEWVTGKTGTEATFTLKHNQSITFTGIPTGTSYTVTEADYSGQNYVTYVGLVQGSAAAGEIKDKNQTDTVAFTNTRKTGMLALTKNLLIFGGNTQLNGTGAITLTLTNNATNESYTMTLNFNNGAVATGNIALPAGTYTITEVNNVVIDGYAWDGTSGMIVGQQIVITDGGTLNHTINNYYKREIGELTITKAFGSGSAFNWDNLPPNVTGFTITVTGPADWVPDVNDYAEFNCTYISAGVYSFRLTYDYRTLTLTDIPVGKYYIYEDKDGAKADSYTLDVTGERTGNNYYLLTKSGAGATITNTYTRHTGSLKVTKLISEVGVSSTSNVTSFGFTVTFSPALPSNYTLPLGATRDDDTQPGKTIFTFSLGNNTTVTFSGIPTGTKYTVEETENSNYRAGWSGDAADGTIETKDKEYAVTCTNTREYGKISVKKTVSGVYDGYERFTFTLLVDGAPWANKAYVLTDSKGDILDDNARTLSTGTFTLGKDEIAVIGDLPLGASYEVTETPHEYYDLTSSSNGIGTIKALGLVEFVNTRKNVELTVKKAELAGDAASEFADEEFTFTLYRKIGSSWTLVTDHTGTGSDATDENGRFTLKAGETAMFKGLPAGEYMVVESGLTVASTISFSTSPDKTQEQKVTTSFTFTFTNKFEYKTGELKVAKSVSAPNPDSAKVYSMTLLKWDETEDEWLPVENHSAQGSAETGANGSFTLTVNETAHFTGLKNGTYRVVEASAEIEPYTWTVTYISGTADVKDSGVTVSDEQTAPPVITVTNTYTRKTGGLKVTKSVIDTEGKSYGIPETFTFTLYSGTGDDKTAYQGTYSTDGGLTTKIAANGVFTLEDGQTAVFANLPTGIYTVVEGDADIPGHTWTVTAGGTDTATATAAVEYGENAELTFTNTYTRQYGSLTVSKAASGYPLTGDWSFDFKIKGPDDWSPAGLGDADANGAYSFTLDSADSFKTFTSLPGGEYTVTEQTPAGVDGYTITTTISVDNGTASVGREVKAAVAQGEREIAFANAYTRDKGSLNLTKLLGGDVAANKFQSNAFTFILNGPDGYSQTIYLPDSGGEWSATISDLSTGVYTLKETETPDLSGYSYAGAAYTVNNQSAPMVDGVITFTVTKNTTVNVICTNEYQQDAGILLVTKATGGYASSEDSFVFQIGPEKLGLDPYYRYYIVGSDGERIGSEKTETTGIFTLKAGQTAVFEGLDTETSYTVTEISRGNFDLTGIELRVGTKTGDDALLLGNPTSAAAEATGMTATMPKKAEGSNPVLSFTFTNTRKTGSLEVRKEMADESNFFGEEFKIMVTFSDESFDPEEWGVSVSENGVIKDKTIMFTLSGGDYGRAEGLPAGLTYTVSEIMSADSKEHFYKAEYEGKEGTVSAGETGICTVTNTRRNDGEITVNKQVFGAAAGNEQFLIEVVLTAPNGADWPENVFEHFFEYDSYLATKPEMAPGEDGKDVIIRFYIEGGGQMKIKNIPSGTTYTLDEILSEEQKKLYVKWIDEYEGYVNPSVDSADSKAGGHPERETILIKNYNIPYDSFIVGKTVNAMPGSALYSRRFTFTVALYQPDAEVSQGWTQLELDSQIQKANELIERFTEELELIEAEIKRLEKKISDSESGYNAALAVLQIAREEYEDAMVQIEADVRNDPDVIATALAARGNAYRDCAVCSGTGEADCHSCGGSGEVLCDDCNGSGYEDENEECQSCGGSGYTGCQLCENGKVTCDDCGGTGKESEIDEALADELEEAVYQRAIEFASSGEKADYDAAVGVFNSDPDVQVYLRAKQELEALEAEAAELRAKISALKNALNSLEAGNYLTIDDDGTITSEWDDDLTPLNWSDDLFEIAAWVEDEGGAIIRYLTPDEIGFVDNGNGTVTFTLAHNQYAELSGLPVGAKYVITEEDPDDFGSEKFTGCTINGESGLIADGVVSEGETGRLHVFRNSYSHLTGSLTVIKSWPNGRGSVSEITVWLTINGERTERFVILNSENDWTGEFAGLAVTSGTRYGISEDVPSGYSAVYSSTGIELDYNSLTGSITVTNRRNTDDPPPDDPPPDDPPPDDPPPDEPPPDDPPEEVEIPEEEVPLGPMESEEGESVEEIELEEEVVPLGDLPLTGGFPISVLGLVGVCMVLIGALLGKKKGKA